MANEAWYTLGYKAPYNFLDWTCLSVVCTPTTFSSMHSSSSLLSGKVCFRSVRSSVLELKLKCITQWLMSHQTLYSSLDSWTVVFCPSYAHPQVWALWTPLHQICLYSMFQECACAGSRVKIKGHNSMANEAWYTLGYIAPYRARLSFVCTPTTFGSMYSFPSYPSAIVCFRSVRPSVRDLKLSQLLMGLDIQWDI